MKIATLLAGGTMMLCVSTSIVVAQQTAPAARPTAAPAAKLMIVTEGVFDITLGKSMDVTDKKVLLSFPPHQFNSRQQFERGEFHLTINGEQSNPQLLTAGKRLDLKKYSKNLGDRGDCILDVVEFNTPKGGLPTATLRLSCE